MEFLLISRSVGHKIFVSDLPSMSLKVQITGPRLLGQILWRIRPRDLPSPRVLCDIVCVGAEVRESLQYKSWTIFFLTGSISFFGSTVWLAGS